MLSIFLVSCASNDEKTYESIYPDRFSIYEKDYAIDFKWANENYGEYTLGDVIGYLIYVEDEADFIFENPNMEYVTFNVIIGKRYNDHYDRVPVYEINEYSDKSIIAIENVQYTYVQIEGSCSE